MGERSKASDRTYEQQLVARAQRGQPDALRELVERHKDRLFAFIWRMARNHHDAEEICQEAFLKAFSALHTFSTKFRFSTWLFTIAYRVCLNRMRRQRIGNAELPWSEMYDAEADADTDVVASEEARHVKQTVWRAVDGLTPQQRAAVLLFYRHSMGCQEIGQVLELPVATVKSHLHRARNRLREMMENLSDGDLQRIRNYSQRVG